MNVLDLFSGIGGFSLGLERAGMRTVAFCEIEPFCRAVLRKHWPNVPIYEDVRSLTAERLAADGIAPDVIAGGFPCQDISIAGRGAGISGSRSGLWKDYARIIGELRPRYVIVENVAALLGRGLGRVLGDLAALGYDAEWHCIPAGAVGAPHLRDRLWIVAYPNGSDVWRTKEPGTIRCGAGASSDYTKGKHWEWHRRRFGNSSEAQVLADTNQALRPHLRWGETLAKFAWIGTIGDTSRWSPEPAVGRLADGLPRRLAGWRKSSIESLGNAVVPQIPEIIGRAIMQADHL